MCRGALSHCRRPADGRLSFASGSGALGTGYNRPQLEFKKYSPEANRQAIVGKVWRHWLKKKINIKLSRIVTKGRDGGAGMKHYRNVILFPTTTKSESRQERPQKRSKDLFISTLSTSFHREWTSIFSNRHCFLISSVLRAYRPFWF